MSHKDNQPWGEPFTSSSLSYRICIKGRNTQTCLCCGECWEGGMGMCLSGADASGPGSWNHMMGGPSPTYGRWACVFDHTRRICALQPSLSAGPTSPPGVSFPPQQPCVASLDASHAPIPTSSDPMVLGAAWAWYFFKGFLWDSSVPWVETY